MSSAMKTKVSSTVMLTLIWDADCDSRSDDGGYDCQQEEIKSFCRQED
jgi:hypothetical protein